MHHVTDALRPYWPLIAAVILWPIVTGALTWYLWWDTAEHWDAFVAKQPRAAFAVRFLRAAGPHLRKLVVAWRDYAASRSALPLASPAPLSVVAEKAGAVAVFDSRPTMAPPAPVAPTPLRAVTMTGVAAADNAAAYELARREVASHGLFDATARQEIAADVVAEAQRLTAAPLPLVHTAASALHGARWEPPANDPNDPKEPA